MDAYEEAANKINKLAFEFKENKELCNALEEGVQQVKKLRNNKEITLLPQTLPVAQIKK